MKIQPSALVIIKHFPFLSLIILLLLIKYVLTNILRHFVMQLTAGGQSGALGASVTSHADMERCLVPEPAPTRHRRMVATTVMVPQQTRRSVC